MPGNPHWTQARLRKVLMAIAVALGLAGAWTLVCELVHPHRDPTAAGQRWRWAIAADVGMIRGDLWASLFLSFKDSITRGINWDGIETSDEALPAAQRALRYAPYRSDVWLLLAELASAHQLQPPSTTSALMMSYYTAPNDPHLAALRLSVATRGEAVSDPNLTQLVEQDL